MLNDEQRRDLLEIVEGRYERRSTIVTSQVPVDHRYDMIGNPTIADAILDRLVHNAYRATVKIGIANLADNMLRYVFHEGRRAAV